MILLKNFLTFCLIVMCIPFGFAENLKFHSGNLNNFYQSISGIKTATLSGEEYCKLFHRKISVSSAVLNFTKLSPTTEEVKEAIVNFEKSDSSFWEKNNLILEDNKLYTLEEIVSSGIFNNMPNILDNVYCFPFLGAGYENNKDRIKVVEALNRVRPNLDPYVYYSDGYQTGSDSVLNAYFLDSVSKEIFALKVIITD